MRTLARGAGWQATTQLAPLVINIVLTPVIITGLGVDRYGLFLLVSVIATVLAAADGGIGATALRYFSVYAGEDDSARTTRLLTTTALAITGIAAVAFGAFFAVAPYGLRLLDIPPDLLPEGTYMLRTLIVITAVAQLRGLFTAVLNAHQRFALTSLTNNLGYVLYIAGVLLTVHNDWGLYGIAVTLVVQQVVATLVIVPASFRHLDRRAVGIMPKPLRREFWRYALHTQWSSAMLLVTLQTDAIVVGAFLPVRQVAYYTTGANFATQMRNVPLNALVPMQSLLGRAVGSSGAEGATSTFERLQRVWVVGTTGWGVVALSASWFGVTAWLGPDFSLSGVVAVIMLSGYLTSLWADVLMVWAQSLGHPEYAARSATIGAVVNLVLTLALVVPLGIIGTVIATASSQVVGALLLLRLARRGLPTGVRSFLLEVPVLPALVTAAVVVALEVVVHPFLPEGPLGLVAAGVVAGPGLVLYAAMTFGVRTSWQFVRDRLVRRSTPLDADEKTATDEKAAT